MRTRSAVPPMGRALGLFRSWVGLAAALTLGSPAAPARSAAVAPATSADTLYAHRDWAQASRAYERVVRSDPADGRAWYRLGVCYGSQSRWKDAVRAYRHADGLGFVPLFTRYNMACAFARAGSIDSAFAALDRAMDAGYRQPQALERDTDLDALKTDPRFAAAVERAKRNATPCAFRPESRQLDFWIGDWDVRDNQRGQAHVGDSHVELILDQCVIFENWTGLFGSGKSLNAWNPELRCWQQGWMDNSGNVTNFSNGHYENGAMVLVAEKLVAGKPELQRLSLFNLGPDRVRQLGERSTDGGATWATRYDYTYLRKP